MKIAVVSSTVFPCPPPGYAGLEQLAWQQAVGLVKKGHEVTLIAPEGSSCEGGMVIPTGPPGGWDEMRAFNSYKEELHKFDVILDNSWHKWSYIPKIEGKLKSPVLGVCHAPINTMYQSLPPIDKPSFVCISQDQANHFEAMFGREAMVCYNGVDMDFYKPLDIPRTNRFLFLARFSTIKGPDLAIDACINASVGLDLVGDTSITQEPEFFEQCKRKAEANKEIRIIGPAKRGECVYWYSQAHCLLHPNQRYREPFGLAPVEAMACGCPVIGWKYGALRETIKNAETGWLVNSPDELLYATKEVAKEKWDKMREWCRQWASQFSIQKMVDRYDALCQNAVETGGW